MSTRPSNPERSLPPTPRRTSPAANHGHRLVSQPRNVLELAARHGHGAPSATAGPSATSTVEDTEVEVVADSVAEIKVVPDVILSAVRVSVVVPTLNEVDNIPHVFDRMPPEVHEVVLVDGHSTDGTVEVARRLWPSLVVIWQSGKGKGNALACGFWAATGDVIVMLDADGSTDPAEIPRFVGPFSPAPTSPRAPASSPAAEVRTSPGSVVSATGLWPKSSTGSGEASTATSATGTTPSGGAACPSSPLTVMASRSRP